MNRITEENILSYPKHIRDEIKYILDNEYNFVYNHIKNNGNIYLNLIREYQLTINSISELETLKEVIYNIERKEKLKSILNDNNNGNFVSRFFTNIYNFFGKKH